MKRKILVGTSGWSYADWAGVVYPTPRRAGFSELGYIARFVDALEINTSFYGPPSPKTCEGWIEKVKHLPDFTFTAKLWRRFTHEPQTPWTATEAARFKDGLAPLVRAGRLGALLVQFPWSLRADDAAFDRLRRLADEFRELPNVVEVRHASWNTPEAMDLLRRCRFSFCNIDQPQSRSTIGRTNLAFGPIAYYRFHGRNRRAWFSRDAGRDERYDYLYTEDELAPRINDIQAIEEKAAQIFVMSNNHYQGQAVVNALQIKARIFGENVPVPERLLEHYPVLRSVARPPKGQQVLPF